MVSTTTPLVIALCVLLFDSALELTWVSNMVQWLHYYAGGQFVVETLEGNRFTLHGKPANLLVDQGHTSNGAAGTALIVVSLGGFLTLWLRSRQTRRDGQMHGAVSGLYYFWLTFTVISFLFTLVALIFTMVVTFQHINQTIDLGIAAALHNQQYPNYVAYPLNQWTPQNWFAAVLDLPLLERSVRNEIAFQLRLMRGWQWNLVPMTIVNLVVMALALFDYKTRRHGRYASPTSEKLRMGDA